MTVKQIDRKIKALEKEKRLIDKKIAPLEEAQRVLTIELMVKKSKYKPGQRVEYRLDGHETVHFGVISTVNAARMWGGVTYLVERINDKGETVGFGNDVMKREIYGSSHK